MLFLETSSEVGKGPLLAKDWFVDMIFVSLI
jgi:hypothetical protein